jgi:hypothetical protein
MAKADESLVSRLEGCTRTLHFTSERVNGAIKVLRALEKHLPRNEEVIGIFRLQLNSIENDMKYLGKIEEAS